MSLPIKVRNIVFKKASLFFLTFFTISSSKNFADTHKVLGIITDIFTEYRNKNSHYDKIFESFKKHIASRYERGEEDNYVDYYLFVSGIVQSRYDHLRSFLSTLHKELLPKELQSFINHDIATQLAYARKLNRLAAKTELVFNREDEKN